MEQGLEILRAVWSWRLGGRVSIPETFFGGLVTLVLLISLGRAQVSSITNTINTAPFSVGAPKIGKFNTTIYRHNGEVSLQVTEN